MDWAESPEGLGRKFGRTGQKVRKDWGEDSEGLG